MCQILYEYQYKTILRSHKNNQEMYIIHAIHTCFFMLIDVNIHIYKWKFGIWKKENVLKTLHEINIPSLFRQINAASSIIVVNAFQNPNQFFIDEIPYFYSKNVSAESTFKMVNMPLDFAIMCTFLQKHGY